MRSATWKRFPWYGPTSLSNALKSPALAVFTSVNLRKKHRSAELSLDECSETEKEWLCREVADDRATPEKSLSRQELYRLLAGVVEQLRPRYRVIINFGM